MLCLKVVLSEGRSFSVTEEGDPSSFSLSKAWSGTTTRQQAQPLTGRKEESQMNFRNRALGCQVPVIGIFYPQIKRPPGEGGNCQGGVRLHISPPLLWCRPALPSWANGGERVVQGAEVTEQSPVGCACLQASCWDHSESSQTKESRH